MFHQPDSSIAELVGKSEADPAMFLVPSPTDIFCELNRAQSLDDAIDQRRRELKLAEARRRCGF